MTATATRPGASGGDPSGPSGPERGRERDEATEAARRRAMAGGSLVADTVTVTWRNLLKFVRQPQVLVFSTVQPIMLVLLFNFVFGGAIGQTIRIPGIDYIDYLLPGILLQAVAFGTQTTSVGMAEDLDRGLIDRFRSLPMSRAAVLAGRVFADAARIAFVVLVMTGVGVLLGYRLNTGPFQAVGAFVLAVGFGLAFTWIAAWIGMTVRNTEAAQSAGIIWLFPLSFASSAFVPIETFDPWLETFARVNPITHFVDALRALTLTDVAQVSTGSQIIPTGRPVLLALAWIAGILAVFAPLAVRQYRRAG